MRARPGISPPSQEVLVMTATAAHSQQSDRGVRAVTAALAALNADPVGAHVEHAIEQAELSLAGLEPSLTAIVLARLLTSIRDCHRDGRRTSDQLRARRASAARALHLDPRGHSDPARKAS
jgi:hypothetical protein